MAILNLISTKITSKETGNPLIGFVKKKKWENIFSSRNMDYLKIGIYLTGHMGKEVTFHIQAPKNIVL